jgi:hypothetical protein
LKSLWSAEGAPAPESQLITPELILHVHATVVAQPLTAQLGR